MKYMYAVGSKYVNFDTECFTMRYELCELNTCDVIRGSLV